MYVVPIFTTGEPYYSLSQVRILSLRKLEQLAKYITKYEVETGYKPRSLCSPSPVTLAVHGMILDPTSHAPEKESYLSYPPQFSTG
jgi:hypothetical protein